MILSDYTISEEISADRLIVDSIDPELTGSSNTIQPASLEVRLSDSFVVFPLSHLVLSWLFPKKFCFDPTKPFTWGKRVTVPKGEYFYLKFLQFALASTDEWVSIPDDLVCCLNGKSTLGRSGLLVHVTAGFIDPGFRGRITLELFNLFPVTVRLKVGMKIGQLVFFRMTTPAFRSYESVELNSKYQDQKLPEEARASGEEKTR